MNYYCKFPEMQNNNDKKKTEQQEQEQQQQKTKKQTKNLGTLLFHHFAFFSGGLKWEFVIRHFPVRMCTLGCLEFYPQCFMCVLKVALVIGLLNIVQYFIKLPISRRFINFCHQWKGN